MKQPKQLPKKIALIVGDFNIGGAQKQAEYVAHAILDLGIELQIYCTNITPVGEPRISRLKERGAKIYFFGQLGGILVRLWKLMRLLYVNKPDMVLTARTYLNLYAALACKILRIPCLGTMRSSLAYEKEDFGRLTILTCILPNALIINSFGLRDELLSTGWVKPSNIYILNNTIDLVEFDAKSLQEDSSQVAKHPIDFYFIGRLSSEKNIPLLLNSLKIAIKSNSEIHLTIVGQGEEEKNLQKLSQVLSIDNNVTFLGYRSDIPGLLTQRADVLLLSSLEEGFPNVLIEAMAAGIPCITTGAGDARIIVEHEKTGFVISETNAEIFAQAMVYLATNAQLSSQMGTEGRKKVKLKYDNRLLHQRIQEILQDFSDAYYA